MVQQSLRSQVADHAHGEQYKVKGQPLSGQSDKLFYHSFGLRQVDPKGDMRARDEQQAQALTTFFGFA